MYSGISQLDLTELSQCKSVIVPTYTDIPVQVSKPVFMPAQSGLAVKIGL